MKIYTLKRSQFLPIAVNEAWDYFSTAKNLLQITPPNLRIQITSISSSDKIYEGQIIKYTINVLPLISTTWITEITRVEEPIYFVDEQRKGPFAHWHHQHNFKQHLNGIEMIDEIDYAIPYSILGKLAHSLFVAQQLKNIFNYRYSFLEKKFRLGRDVQLRNFR